MKNEHDTATIDIPPAGAGPQMRMVAVASIVASTTNPRKTFDQAKLAELAESIKASGVHQPILLRPLPASRVEETTRAARLHPQAAWPFPKPTKSGPPIEYELVAGERRWRACQLAAVAEVPAMIRELTDAQVLEIQIVENLQREDVTELEEAEGYGYLMEANKVNADQVAEKIGKSRSYVYARLKLLDLCSEVRAAMHAGDLDASRGLLLARIPDSALQIKALKEATRKDGLGEAMSYRSLQTWLRQNVMLALERAVFPIADSSLVKKAGSCKECPKRTGANPDLFAEIPKGSATDLCTDPACYHGKEDAHRAQLRKKAEAKGMTIIEGKEAAEITRSYNSNYIDGYTRLDTQRFDTADGEAKPMRDLLGKGAPQPVLIEHPQTKELIEAVPTAEAEAWLVTQGVLKATQAKVDVEAQIKHITERYGYRIANATAQAAQDAVTEALRSQDMPSDVLMNSDFLRGWLIEQIGCLANEDMAEALTLPEAPEGESYSEFLDRARIAAQRLDGNDLDRAVVITMMLSADSIDGRMEVARAAAKAIKLDVEPAVKAAEKALRKEAAEAIAKLQPKVPAAEKPAKKLQKGAAATNLAAPAGEGAGGEAQGEQADKATPTLKPAARAAGKGAKKGAAAADQAPKTSKAQAAQDIAAGLQALEQEAAPGGAAAPQGDEAPALAGAADAAAHAPAEAHVQAPTAQGVDRQPGAPAQAAEAGDLDREPSPEEKEKLFADLEKAFPASAAASQGGAPQTPAPSIREGALVKVKADAKGPSGRVRKVAGKVGVVLQAGAESIIVAFGPQGQDRVGLDAGDVDAYTPIVNPGDKVRVITATNHNATKGDRTKYLWATGRVESIQSDGWNVAFRNLGTDTFDEAQLEVIE